MGTDYNTEPLATDVEIYARLLIAVRDHSLPLPLMTQLIPDAPKGPLLGLYFHAVGEVQSWLDHLGPDRIMYGWKVSPSGPTSLTALKPISSAERAAVDDAVSDFESQAEESVIAAFNRIAPEAISRIETRAGQCLVPYIRNVSDDGMLYDLVSECVRPKGHLGDHADGAHQWKNDYNDTDFRTVTP